MKQYSLVLYKSDKIIELTDIQLLSSYDETEVLNLAKSSGFKSYTVFENEFLQEKVKDKVVKTLTDSKIIKEGEI